MSKKEHAITSDNKRILGQFYTRSNPFGLDVFQRWFFEIPYEKRQVILEPFAGANHIVEMIHEIGINSIWECYDILPSEYSFFLQYDVIKKDTLKDFPVNHTICITNPPYLAKNSATRRKLKYPDTQYDDLYKYSLDIMLKNLEYVACIIPESFITQNLFHDRLVAVSSLTNKMFHDTECPVCLALFSPKNIKRGDNFDVYILDEYIGSYFELRNSLLLVPSEKKIWKFNDKNGNVGIRCVDSNKKADIRFIFGDEIDPDEIKKSSRALTRVSGLPNQIEKSIFIRRCNIALNTYRKNTKDIFLTSFKGLRDDGYYRRRLDFKTARFIMDHVLNEMIKEMKND